MSCKCAASNDPRYQESCYKCGKRLHPGSEVVKLPGIDPSRDEEFETWFLGEALSWAQRLTGIMNMAYPIRVNRRLDIGRERYGDGDFLTKDNLQEVLEETPDLAGYAMLELQRLRRDSEVERTVYEDVKQDLVAVAAYGAIADYYAQRAAQRLRDE